MKIAYELTKKEKEKYRKEYSELETSKSLKSEIFTFLVVSLAAFFAFGFTSALIEEGEKGAILGEIYNISACVAIVAAISFFASYLYDEIRFMRWLTLKHKVKY